MNIFRIEQKNMKDISCIFIQISRNLMFSWETNQEDRFTKTLVQNVSKPFPIPASSIC